MAKKKKVLQQAARKLITRANPKSFVSEQYRTVRTNITFSVPDKELQTLVFTSASPGEGKSTTASNLAFTFASEGKRVLLIDADMRKPTVHYTFHLTNTLGLSNLLTRKAALQDVIKDSGTDNLHIITCGPIPPNPAELLGSKTMDQVLEELKKVYDLIIFDAPPVLAVTDSQILANKCEGTVIVISAGSTEKESVIKTIDLLSSSKAHIIGTVLNNFKLGKEHNYYQYYGTTE